jgi:beta-lactam-binding protein with PASTA domain
MGVVIEEVEDYTGQTLDEVRIRLQTLFSGVTKPLIVLGEPLYESNIAEPGTVLQQTPLPGTPISDPVTVRLVVSRGPQYERTRTPYLVGMTVNDVLQQLARTKIIFDFTSRTATAGEKANTVVAQDPITAEYVSNYSRYNAVFAFGTESNEVISGLFTVTLPEYPYAVPMRLDVKTPDSGTFTLVSFNHPGGKFTVPYTVPRGSELVLYAAGRETAKQIVSEQ